MKIPQQNETSWNFDAARCWQRTSLPPGVDLNSKAITHYEFLYPVYFEHAISYYREIQFHISPTQRKYSFRLLYYDSHCCIYIHRHTTKILILVCRIHSAVSNCRVDTFALLYSHCSRISSNLNEVYM